MIVAGCELKGDDAPIYYWCVIWLKNVSSIESELLCRDPRNPAAPLRTHSSTHSDDVTAVHFSKPPGSEVLLLSVSCDGLICTSNPYEDDEDEAGIHVGNWGCSVSDAGWIDGTGMNMDKEASVPRIWARSDMETFSTWSEEVNIFLFLFASLNVAPLHPDAPLFSPLGRTAGQTHGPGQNGLVISRIREQAPSCFGLLVDGLYYRLSQEA